VPVVVELVELEQVLEQVLERVLELVLELVLVVGRQLVALVPVEIVEQVALVQVVGR
jgi:hypothetical protein